MVSTSRFSEAESLARRAVSIMLQFSVETGHVHPDFEVFAGAYRRILKCLGIEVNSLDSRLRDLLKPIKPA